MLKAGTAKLVLEPTDFILRLSDFHLQHLSLQYDLDQSKLNLPLVINSNMGIPIT